MHQQTVTIGPFDLLELEWEEDFMNMTIKRDGSVIGSFVDKDELKLGRRFSLPDQRQITVIYTEFGLEVWLNGVELVSGGKSGSVEGFANAVKGLTWVGVAQLVFALFLFFIDTDKSRLAATIGLVIAGSLLLGLAFWAKQTGSKIPFWIGIVFCALNILVTIASGSASGILITGVLLYYLYKGTKSEAPIPKRKQFNDPNAPLDSNL